MKYPDNIERAHTPGSGINRAGSRRRRNRLWLIALFCVAMAATLCLSGDVLRKKWGISDYSAQQVVQGYYLEPAHTLDVLCVGASSLRGGISGLEMYHDYGFTTYCRATSVQLPVISYHLLLETLDRHDIKAVVVDVTALTNSMLNGYTKESIVGKIHEAVDYMPWSARKIDLIREILQMDLPASWLDFLFPLYTYHDRWAELSEDDFTYRSWQADYRYKGQNPVLAAYRHTFDEQYMADEGEEDDSFWLDEGSIAQYRRMIALCRQRGIAIVLVKTPSDGWSNYNHDLIDAFARENDVDFIDFNLPELQNEMDFDPQQDFSDSTGHANITGAMKISRYLGAYLSGKCDFEDKRTDAAYASWDADYEKYASLLSDAELVRETNLIGYLQKLDNPNYITMLVTRGDTSRCFNEYIGAALSDLGIDAPFGEKKNLSYAAVLRGNQPVYEAWDDDPFSQTHTLSESMDLEGHSIRLTSCAVRINNLAEIIFDGEDLTPAGMGFCFVVYDQAVNRIVSQKAFNTGLRGADYAPPNPFAGTSEAPLAYLDCLSDDDYITVIQAHAKGSRYMPWVVNDKLAGMGLIPLDGEFDRPYIAILNGGEVVFNEYGERGGEISVEREVDGVHVVATSSAQHGAENGYISIGIEETRRRASHVGLTFYVYSKSQQKIVSFARFDWSKDYLSNTRVDGLDDPLALLSIAAHGGYDVLCVGDAAGQDGIGVETLFALRESGFSQLGESAYYAGVLGADGSVLQESRSERASLQVDLDGVSADLSAGEDGCVARFYGAVEYAPGKPGIYLYLYDRANRAVLTEVRVGP